MYLTNLTEYWSRINFLILQHLKRFFQFDARLTEQHEICNALLESTPAASKNALRISFMKALHPEVPIETADPTLPAIQPETLLAIFGEWRDSEFKLFQQSFFWP